MKKIFVGALCVSAFSCQSKTLTDKTIVKEKTTIEQTKDSIISSREEEYEKHSLTNATASVELAGYVNDYNPSSKKGCLFIDKDMVKQGIVSYDSSDASENCYSDKYGYGLSINFTKIQQSSAYTSPKQGVLYSFKGTWDRKTKIPVFYVESFEPFF